MEEKKDNRIIPFLIGLFMGWKGIQITTHLIYIGIIISLATLLVLK
jgi:hypothetical protein